MRDKIKITSKDYLIELENVLYDRSLCEILDIDYNRINYQDVKKARFYLNRIYEVKDRK